MNLLTNYKCVHMSLYVYIFHLALDYFGNYYPALVVGMGQLMLVLPHLAKFLNQ